MGLTPVKLSINNTDTDCTISFGKDGVVKVWNTTFSWFCFGIVVSLLKTPYVIHDNLNLVHTMTISQFFIWTLLALPILFENKVANPKFLSYFGLVLRRNYMFWNISLLKSWMTFIMLISFINNQINFIFAINVVC